MQKAPAARSTPVALIPIWSATCQRECECYKPPCLQLKAYGRRCISFAKRAVTWVALRCKSHHWKTIKAIRHHERGGIPTASIVREVGAGFWFYQRTRQ